MTEDVSPQPRQAPAVLPSLRGRRLNPGRHADEFHVGSRQPGADYGDVAGVGLGDEPVEEPERPAPPS